MQSVILIAFVLFILFVKCYVMMSEPKAVVKFDARQNTRTENPRKNNI